ncbi:MAG: PDZ domain-containing protein [Rhizobiales bacterium]|nr:PDZ domain-containing protein [Hyphomicrobiales bacterium]
MLKEGEKKAIAEISDNTEDEAVTQTVLGLELLELNKTLNKRYKLDPKTKGLMIVSVEDDSVAAEKRLRPGDRIVAAALKDVETFEELNKLIDKTKDKGRKRILLLIEQPDGNSRSVALPLD